MDKVFEEIKAFCKDCPAWSGTDCTRNPHTEGCLKDISVCPVCGKPMAETYRSTHYCYECERKLKTE